jgi:hypothetical protein
MSMIEIMMLPAKKTPNSRDQTGQYIARNAS